MAYTRGTARRFTPSVDGELVAPPIRVMAAPNLPTPVQRSTEEFECTAETVQRSIEPAELVKILELMFGHFRVVVDADAFVKLSPDVKRHFRGVSL
jgi:hypothetical protein